MSYLFMKKSFIVETFDNFILFEPLFLGKKLKSHNKSQATLKLKLQPKNQIL